MKDIKEVMDFYKCVEELFKTGRGLIGDKTCIWVMAFCRL